MIQRRPLKFLIGLALAFFSLKSHAASEAFSKDCDSFVSQLIYLDIDFREMNMIDGPKPKRIAELENFLTQEPDMVNCTTRNRERPLGVLLETAFESEARFYTANFLIHRGAAVDFIHSDGRSPIGLLIWAYVSHASRKFGTLFPVPKTLELLVEKGASVTAPNALKYCEFCPVPLLKKLIELGADPQQEFDSALPSQKGWTLIHHYCDQSISPPSAIRFLVSEANVDVNLPTSGSGETPLHIAARKCALEKVAMLLKLGADPLRANNNGLIPLSLVGENSRAHELDSCDSTRSFLKKATDQMAVSNRREK